MESGHEDHRRRRRRRHRHGLHRHRPRRGACAGSASRSAACSAARQSAAQPGRRALGVARAYASLDDLLADPGVDVVHVTSPNDLHLPQAKAALAAGRHVVCEKPLAMTATESRELVELAASSGLVNAANFNIRYYPLNQHAHEVVDGGRDRRRPARHRPLLPGLAAARERLELAARARPRRRAPRGRRHRLALARPDDLRDRPARRRGHGRPGHLHPHPPRADRPGRDLLDRASRPRPSPASIATEDAATILLRFEDGARGAVSISQISAGPEELAPVRDRRVASRRSPGTRSSRTSSGSAIATAPTRS